MRGVWPQLAELYAGVIALPRKLSLYIHTAAASEGSKNTEDVLQKEEGKCVFTAVQKNYVMRQRVRGTQSIISSLC